MRAIRAPCARSQWLLQGSVVRSCPLRARRAAFEPGGPDLRTSRLGRDSGEGRGTVLSRDTRRPTRHAHCSASGRVRQESYAMKGRRASQQFGGMRKRNKHLATSTMNPLREGTDVAIPEPRRS